jgi:hypothetical protein
VSLSTKSIVILNLTEDRESRPPSDGGVKMLPITNMIYNQSILTTTQYEDQSPGDKRHNFCSPGVHLCTDKLRHQLCRPTLRWFLGVTLKSLSPQCTPRKAPQDTLSSEVTQRHAQCIRVAFGTPLRKAQEPLTINRRWPRTISFSCQ